ncbi:MAG: ATP-binding protein [Alphaproteobacteria bacterium]|nr:ATP-binding protein [Alphaproteobacteria bacterium]
MSTDTAIDGRTAGEIRPNPVLVEHLLDYFRRVGTARSVIALSLLAVAISMLLSYSSYLIFDPQMFGAPLAVGLPVLAPALVAPPTTWLALSAYHRAWQAEQILRQSQINYRDLFESAQVGLARARISDGSMLDANGRAAEIFGYDSRQHFIAEFIASEHYVDPTVRERMVAEGLRSGSVRGLEIEVSRRDGSTAWLLVDVTFSPEQGYMEPVFVDITLRKEQEEQARRLQAELTHVSRLSLIGGMATELAHELNQPLSAIASYANGCIRRLALEERESTEILEALRKIAEQAHRANEIITRTRHFVRKEEPNLVPCDVNAIIRETLALLEIEAQRHGVTIDLDLALAPALPMVMADSIQMQQVIHNIARNGMEAMRDAAAAPRLLSISTRATNTPGAPGAPGTQGLEVAIKDTGDGLSIEARAHLFEPFYSSKPQGVGMGLSICRNILDSHGGRLWARPDQDGGAVFCFSLPATESDSRVIAK